MGLQNRVFDHETRKSGLFPCYRLKINDFLSSYSQTLKIDIFTPLQQIPCYCKGRLGTLRVISWWRVTNSTLPSDKKGSCGRMNLCDVWGFLTSTLETDDLSNATNVHTILLIEKPRIAAMEMQSDACLIKLTISCRFFEVTTNNDKE